jgi:hypothetical protein
MTSIRGGARWAGTVTQRFTPPDGMGIKQCRDSVIPATIELFGCVRNPWLNFAQEVVLIPFVRDRVFWIPHPSLEAFPRLWIVRGKISRHDLIRPEGTPLRFDSDQVGKRDLDAIVSQALYVNIHGSIQIKDADTLPGFRIFCDNFEFSRINCEDSL